MLNRLIIPLAVLALPSIAQAWTLPAATRVVTDPSLGDAAAAVATPAGPVIVINPLRMGNAPPALKEFVLAHEYAHIALGHLDRPQSQAVPAWAQQLEKEADCYAGRVIGDEAAEAAATYFERLQGPTSADARHPTGYERAATVRACHAEGRRDYDQRDAPRCRTVTHYETVTTYEPRPVTVMQPVPQCGVVLMAWGPQQVCTTVMVPRTVMQQVPVTRRVPTTSESCE